MLTYKITAFEPTGEKLLDESFQATNDTDAKNKGEQILNEKGYLEKTHRCVSPTGKLVLFHV
ncbi:YhzD family protein [Pseudoneobacillus sp. C159]